jgi:hypothetical protein
VTGPVSDGGPAGADRLGPTAFRCSDAGREAGDALEGTAPPADLWFLVEHPGPWDAYILGGGRIDPTAAAALGRWSREQRGRVLLVRRPGRTTRAAGPRRWFRVDSRPGRESIRTEVFTAERELADVVVNPDAGEPHDEPLYLVCAHGKHDICCAVRGRPLAAGLAAAVPGAVWESSHLGGCRFAAAMVLLPHGVVLGDVPVAAGPDVAARYASGLLPMRWVRGRSALAPVVQAAEHHARVATGEYRLDALRPVDARPDPTDEATWRVAFTDPDVTVVLGERRVVTDRRLTCAAKAPGWLRVFDLVELAVGAPTLPVPR